MYEKFTPVIHRDDLTLSEFLLVQELDSLANSGVGQFLRKVGGTIVNATPSGTGGGIWGGIVGTLSNQTDLQSALNAKQATLVSGTNIKTINSATILGSGNIAILPGGSNTQFQYNDVSAFAGASRMTYDKATNRVSINGADYTSPLNVKAENSLGDELVVNGTFTGNANSWTLGSGWSYGANKISFSMPTGPIATYDIANAGTGYQIGDVLTVSGGGGNATITVLNITLTPRESSTTGYNSRQLYGGTGTEERLGQTFTASASYSLKYIEVYLIAVGGPTDNVFVELHSTDPSGTLLGTSNSIAYNALGNGANGYTRFTFSSPISITNTNVYGIAVARDGSRDTSNYYQLYVNPSNPYAGGQNYHRNNGVWSNFVDEDFNFLTYDNLGGPISDSSLTAPGTGYAIDTTHNLTGGSGSSATLHIDTLNVTTTTSQDIVVSDSSVYQVIINVGGTTGSVGVAIGSNGSSATINAGSGSTTVQCTASLGSEGIFIYPSNDFDGSVDDISVKLIIISPPLTLFSGSSSAYLDVGDDGYIRTLKGLDILGVSGQANIYTINSSIVNTAAATLNIYGGVGMGSGAGGAVFLHGGNGGTTGNGGYAELDGGNGGVTSGDGGGVYLDAGGAHTGTAGGVFLHAGGVSVSGNSDNIEIIGGNGNGMGNHGSRIKIISGLVNGDAVAGWLLLSTAVSFITPSDGAMNFATDTGLFNFQNAAATYVGILDFSSIASSNKTFAFPNASGTLAVSASGNIALSALGDITFTGQLPVANGGTNIASYAVGDLLYASGSTTLSKLADVATGNALISGGVTTAPSWGKIGLTTHVSGILPLANGGTGATTLLGAGIPAVVGNDRKTALTAAQALATYTVGASDSTFIVSANILITTSTLYSISVTVSYTDEGNTSRVLTLNFSQLTGVFVTTITNALAAPVYEGVPLHIRCKASTTIIVATTGTFTTVTYNLEERIIQL